MTTKFEIERIELHSDKVTLYGTVRDKPGSAVHGKFEALFVSGSAARSYTETLSRLSKNIPAQKRPVLVVVPTNKASGNPATANKSTSIPPANLRWL